MNSYITSIKLSLLFLALCNDIGVLHASKKSDPKFDRKAMRDSWEKRAEDLKKKQAASIPVQSKASADQSIEQSFSVSSSASHDLTSRHIYSKQEHEVNAKNSSAALAADPFQGAAQANSSTHTASSFMTSQQLTDLDTIRICITTIKTLTPNKSPQGKMKVAEELLKVLNHNATAQQPSDLHAIKAIDDKIQSLCSTLLEQCTRNPSVVSGYKTNLKRIADELRQEMNKFRSAIKKPSVTIDATATQTQHANTSSARSIENTPASAANATAPTLITTSSSISASSQASTPLQKRKTVKDREEKHKAATAPSGLTQHKHQAAATIPAQRPAQIEPTVIEVGAKKELTVAKIKSLLTQIKQMATTQAQTTEVRPHIEKLYYEITQMPETTSSISDMIILIEPALAHTDIETLKQAVLKLNPIIDKLKKSAVTPRSNQRPSAKNK